MGTLADKLNKTLDTKNRIASAIEEMSGKNPGAVFADYPNAIRAIPTGGGGWTGHADVEGLKAIGWDDEDIAYYQEHGVNWNEDDDQYHLVPEDNKALYGIINIDNIQDYKAILVYLPKIDTTGVKNMSSKFQNCFSLVAIPMMDTSSVTNMSSIFTNCYSLATVPLFDMSSVNSANLMFSYCYSIQYFPPLDFSKCTNLQNLYSNSGLSLFPDLNTPECTNFLSMFVNDFRLNKSPIIDTSAGTNLGNMYANCYSLVEIPGILDLSKATNVTTMFNRTYSLRYFQIKGIGLDIDISASSFIEKSSLLYMIENAAPTDAITITLSAYCYNKFSSDPDVVAALSSQPLVSLASV